VCRDERVVDDDRRGEEGSLAVHDWDDGQTGKSLFEQWSRGSGWDSDSQRHIDNIWSGADQGEGITVGTLIHHAQEAGWSPSGSSRQKAKAVDEVQGADTSDAQAPRTSDTQSKKTTDQQGGGSSGGGVEADGGVAAATESDQRPTIDEDPDDRAARRLRERVVTPLDPPDDWEGEEIDKRIAAHRTAEIYLKEYNWLGRARTPRVGEQRCTTTSLRRASTNPTAAPSLSAGSTSISAPSRTTSSSTRSPARLSGSHAFARRVSTSRRSESWFGTESWT
jgi:hypothetical protein